MKWEKAQGIFNMQPWLKAWLQQRWVEASHGSSHSLTAEQQERLVRKRVRNGLSFIAFHPFKDCSLRAGSEKVCWVPPSGRISVFWISTYAVFYHLPDEEHCSRNRRIAVPHELHRDPFTVQDTIAAITAENYEAVIDTIVQEADLGWNLSAGGTGQGAVFVYVTGN